MRKGRYTELDVELDLLRDELLDEDLDDVEYRKVVSKMSAIQELKAKELDLELKRKELGSTVSADTLVSAGVSLLTFGLLTGFEKTDVMTLKNAWRHLNPFRTK